MLARFVQIKGKESTVPLVRDRYIFVRLEDARCPTLKWASLHMFIVFCSESWLLRWQQ